MSFKKGIKTLKHAGKIFYKKIDTPIYIILFVTERCNARCKHCFGSFGIPKEQELRLEEYEQISRHMGDLLYLLPTGGEPFLREDLPEIISIFYNNNGLRNAGIPTNGSLTAKTVDSLERLLSRCPDLNLGVDISIDDLGERHDEIRGFSGLFDRAVETYWRLKQMEERHKNFKVCVEVTVSHYNQNRLDEIYDYFINELKAYNVFVRLVRGNPRDPEAKDVDIDRYERFVMRVEEDIRNGVFYGHKVYPFSELITARDIIGRKTALKAIREKKMQIPCYAGNLTGVITSNGEVYPCEILNKKMGSLREHHYDLKALWSSKRADDLRREIKESHCFCTHECFITNNIMFNPLIIPRLLGEYVKLKLR